MRGAIRKPSLPFHLPVKAPRPDDMFLEVERRRRLFESVEAYPGAHLRDLARRSSVPLGTALYHLDRLEAFGLVTVHRDGRYKRYFAGPSVGVAEKALVSALRHATPRRIVEALLVTEPSTQRALSVAIGVSRSTLSAHIRQLVEDGIVLCSGDGIEGAYRLRDRGVVARALAAMGPGDAARRVHVEPSHARAAAAMAETAG